MNEEMLKKIWDALYCKKDYQVVVEWWESLPGEVRALLLPVRTTNEHPSCDE